MKSDSNALIKAYALATTACIHFLGLGWAERYVFQGGGPNPFLLQPSLADATLENLDLMFFRTIDLGELLYNLQSVPGFEGRLAQLAGGKIEDTRAELESGKLLWMQGVPFRFVDVQGIRGADYDIEVRLRDGTWIAADTKNKIESTEPSESTLGKARSQLPEDRPGFIFLRVPGSWLLPDPKKFEPAERAINSFLRTTGRIASVKLHTLAIQPASETQAAHSVVVQEFNSAHCRFTSPVGWDILTPPKTQLRWNFLFRMAGYPLPVFRFASK